jgi:hypothetical protein
MTGVEDATRSSASGSYVEVEQVTAIRRVLVVARLQVPEVAFELEPDPFRGA